MQHMNQIKKSIPTITQPLQWLSYHSMILSRRVGIVWSFILGGVFLLLGWMLFSASLIGLLLSIPAFLFGGMMVFRGLV